MKYKYLILLAFFFLIACGNQGSESADTDTEAVVLVEVDGTPVTLTMLEVAMEARGVAENDHEAMRELLDELIRMQVVANAARSEGLDRNSKVRAQLRLAELQTLSRHYLERAQRGQTISEQDIRDVYAAQLQRSGDTQYRIEIIGYDNQARALKAIERVQEGAVDYAALRTEAQAAGLMVDEPGWIDRSQVPEGFAALLVEAGTGEIVPQPLENPRGWFVVRVSEKRDLQVPPFEQVRDGIARSLRQQQGQTLVESLYDQAEITPMLPLEQADSDTDTAAGPQQ
ncbi:MAG TPA: peptidylprolyl isomerase [Wenzhouxiangella sp.]|nr:peptidylprolyl isomerase [Wenzhouxiangella sp.]